MKGATSHGFWSRLSPREGQVAALLVKGMQNGEIAAPLGTTQKLPDGPSGFRADKLGCLSFTVDLGPPHALEQGTPEHVAAAGGDPNYFVTRNVLVTPLPEGGGSVCTDDARPR